MNQQLRFPGFNGLRLSPAQERIVHGLGHSSVSPWTLDAVARHNATTDNQERALGPGRRDGVHNDQTIPPAVFSAAMAAKLQSSSRLEGSQTTSLQASLGTGKKPPVSGGQVEQALSSPGLRQYLAAQEAALGNGSINADDLDALEKNSQAPGQTFDQESF